MSLSAWFLAAFQLGLPMAVMSWLMFNWLYGAGQLPREAGHKAIREHLTTLRKHHKTSKAKSSNYMYKQWLFFGGGFYGLAVLWTLLVIEAGEAIGFLLNFDLAALLADGVIALIVAVILAQIGNIITALIWFAYWPTGGGSNVVPWLAAAYGGYLLGIHYAREGQTLHSLSDLLKKRGRRQERK